MGPGTIRCLAHSAWPMLWVRQCALSPYPLLDYLSSRSVHGARRRDSAAASWVNDISHSSNTGTGCQRMDGSELAPSFAPFEHIYTANARELPNRTWV